MPHFYGPFFSSLLTIGSKDGASLDVWRVLLGGEAKSDTVKSFPARTRGQHPNDGVPQPNGMVRKAEDERKICVEKLEATGGV